MALGGGGGVGPLDFRAANKNFSTFGGVQIFRDVTRVFTPNGGDCKGNGTPNFQENPGW